MIETIKEILVMAAPLVAGFITSVLIPFLVKKQSMKSLQKKIDEVNEGEQLKKVNEKLASIEKEILLLRGKAK